MAIKDAFIAELKHEGSMTRKMLEKVPLDKKDWTPHEKSMTLGRLASHTAEIGHWASDIVNISDYNFAKNYKPGTTASTTEELIKIHDDNLDKAIIDLGK